MGVTILVRSSLTRGCERSSASVSYSNIRFINITSTSMVDIGDKREKKVSDDNSFLEILFFFFALKWMILNQVTLKMAFTL